MPIMRAKMEVRKVDQSNPPGSSETLHLSAVCGSTPFGADGESEDNTYSKWTPSASLEMTITNPNLHGKFSRGQKFYVDFTEAV